MQYPLGALIRTRGCLQGLRGRTHPLSHLSAWLPVIWWALGTIKYFPNTFLPGLRRAFAHPSYSVTDSLRSFIHSSIFISSACVPGPGVNEIGEAPARGTACRGRNRHCTYKTGGNPCYRLLCVLGRNQIVSRERRPGRGPWLLWGGQGRPLRPSSGSWDPKPDEESLQPGAKGERSCRGNKWRGSRVPSLQGEGEGTWGGHDGRLGFILRDLGSRKSVLSGDVTGSAGSLPSLGLQWPSLSLSAWPLPAHPSILAQTRLLCGAFPGVPATCNPSFSISSSVRHLLLSIWYYRFQVGRFSSTSCLHPPPG